MLTIRKEQIDRFREAETDKFVDRMRIYIKDFFPDQYRKSREERTRDAIRFGIDRAATYGVKSQRGVAQYIDTMFMFGKHFDSDPNLPWASQILRDESIVDPADKMNQLSAAADEHAAQATGLGTRA